MDSQDDVSKNIIDHRPGHVATHGLAGIVGSLVGLLLGLKVGDATAPPAVHDPDDDLVHLVSAALDRGQDYWAGHLEPNVWRQAHVVFVAGQESTPCGTVSQTTGPFYCPANERIYVDLSFLRAIDGNAKSLAVGYVVGHELGHHVQKLRGEFARRPSIDVELQADCYAGMWMRSERDGGHLSETDVPDALAEAKAVGDDRIAPGSTPETWTHGSSEQRAEQVLRGLANNPCR